MTRADERPAGTGTALSVMALIAAAAYMSVASGAGTWRGIGIAATTGLMVIIAAGIPLMATLRSRAPSAAMASRLMAAMGAAAISVPIAVIGIAAST